MRRLSIGMKRLCIAGVLLVVAMVGVVWWDLRQSAARTFTLPNGSQVYFRGATIGRNASMDFGSFQERMLRHMPKELGWKQKRHVFAHKAEQQVLTFWF